MKNPIGRPKGFQDHAEEATQLDMGYGLQQELFGDDAHKHLAVDPVRELEESPPHTCGPGSLAHGVTCDGCAWQDKQNGYT